jgi:hypothetical protein
VGWTATVPKALPSCQIRILPSRHGPYAAAVSSDRRGVTMNPTHRLAKALEWTKVPRDVALPRAHRCCHGAKPHHPGCAAPRTLFSTDLERDRKARGRDFEFRDWFSRAPGVWRENAADVTMQNVVNKSRCTPGRELTPLAARFRNVRHLREHSKPVGCFARWPRAETQTSPRRPSGSASDGNTAASQSLPTAMSAIAPKFVDQLIMPSSRAVGASSALGDRSANFAMART